MTIANVNDNSDEIHYKTKSSLCSNDDFYRNRKTDNQISNQSIIETKFKYPSSKSKNLALNHKTAHFFYFQGKKKFCLRCRKS